VADDTNQKLASGLDAVQDRIDRIVGNPLTLGAITAEGRAKGFPAQYQDFDTPPLTEKVRVFHNIANAYPGGLPAPHIAMALGESDVEAWRKKEKMLEQIHFDGWISRRFDPFRDPSIRIGSRVFIQSISKPESRRTRRFTNSKLNLTQFK